MAQKAFLFVLIVLVLAMAPSAFAGKMELTTYYPAPYGEYKDIKASGSLKVPVKTVGTDTTKVTAGEIWVEG